MKLCKDILCIVLCAMLLIPCVSCAKSADDNSPSTTVTTADSSTEAKPSSTTPSQKEPEPETEPEPLDEFLVSKWDFEGSNALMDKCTDGTVTEPIRTFGSTEVKSGILSVYGAAGSYATIEYPFESDITDLKNKTVVFKARISADLTDGYKNNISGLFSK